VLEGEALYRYGRQEVHLREGDSICLDAELRYGIQKVLTPRLRFLSVQAERR
jgi:mannose-6-phosphate isomerase-like protein (cupin superfamily)